MGWEVAVERKNQGLETLAVWQKAVDYAVDVCQNVIPNFPPEEKWALSSQLRRSVQSIPANIAEGYGRYKYQESIHFFYIARGSMAETKTFLVIAARLGYLQETVFQEYLVKLVDLGKMIHGYIAHLRKQQSIHGVRETAIDEEAYEL
jgi:four helix bundle protein